MNTEQASPTRDEALVAEMSASSTPGKFFRRVDWSAFWTACILSFLVYFYTLPPSVTLEDCGELAVAGDHLGVPHPPGYPIWTLLAWVFSRVFSFVTYRGQPNPAWAIALLSAVCGAIAAGLTAMLICRSGSDILRESKHAAHAEKQSTENLICWVSGVACSLLFAFSPNMWSQSVIVEVYSLNALFLILIFLLVYMWIRRPSNTILFATAFVFGLGLTNYQVLLLVVLALMIAIMLKDIELFRDFVIAGTPYLLVIYMIKEGYLVGIEHPLDRSCALYMSLNILVLTLVYFCLPRGKTVAVSILLMQLGVAFYAYEPIVSDLRNPPMNWGYPRTWEGFKHAVSRGQYEKINPSNVFSMQFIHQVGVYLGDLRGQFTLLAAPLGFLPFTVWQIKLGKRRFSAIYAAIGVTILAVAVAMLARFVPAADAFLNPVYKLLFIGVLMLVTVGGFTLLLDQGSQFFQMMIGRKQVGLSGRVMAALVLLGALGVLLIFVKEMGVNLVEVTAPLRQTQALSAARINLIVFKSVAIVIGMLFPFAMSFLILLLMHSRAELRMTIGQGARVWVIPTLFAFLTLSLLLISLANLKLDIQDTFIQRVKFISSHALYAFWIGYGMIFGLALADHLSKGNRALRALAFAGALALPLWPLWENQHNDELIRTYGGAEQNGHDFGWQFGNYQLRGADAISEELAPDEEPLPNPEFPEAMTPHAVFYGGTDPGRFVPTYMIYSARVREDVHLITQNALADGTFMSVTRDLYGDDIWIPAQPDSALAFQIYVEEVRSGKRPQNAELQIDNGRVQVSGALGVMEINGILAKMIFDHNSYRHDFYVEESYVIRWMYPYMEPHGLIMKINRDDNKDYLTAEVVRNDTDFWDWYTRRLVGDERFRRDVVARKSFSKLRSAIAGLYADRGRLGQAENAFQQSRLLYPLSPEANFRLVQEVLLRNRQRVMEARMVMADFARQDPLNAKAPQFIEYIDQRIAMDQRMAELEALLQQGKIDINQTLELAAIYQRMGLLPQLQNFASALLRTKNLQPVVAYRLAQILSQSNLHSTTLAALALCANSLPPGTQPEIDLDIARMFRKAGDMKGMEKSLTDYLRKRPDDWKAWLDLAALQIPKNQLSDAVNSLSQAIKTGGQEALRVIQQDKRFAPFIQQALAQIRTQGNLRLPDMH